MKVVNVGAAGDGFAAEVSATKLASNRLRLLRTTAPHIQDEVCAAVAAVGQGGCSLDIIGHAADGVMTIGHLRLDGLGWTEAHRTQLRARVRRIRLLGCGTVSIPDGQAALSSLADALAIEVFGTTRVIGADDFNDDGFLDGESGRPAPKGAPLLSSQHAGDTLALQSLHNGTAQRAWLAQFQQVPVDLDTLEPIVVPVGAVVSAAQLPFQLPPRAAMISSIATPPDRVVAIRTSSGHVVAIELLVGGTLARLRSALHGALYAHVPAGARAAMLALAPMRHLASATG